jgi:hypothetical protein
MSTRNRIALAAALALLCSAARGDGISSSISPQLGGGIGQFDGGVSARASSSAPPPTCTVNLSSQYNNKCSSIFLRGR